jgi:hypothetical protein
MFAQSADFVGNMGICFHRMNAYGLSFNIELLTGRPRYVSQFRSCKQN